MTSIKQIKNILFIGDSFATETLGKCLEKDLGQILPQDCFPIHLLGFPGGGLRHIFPPVKKWLDSAPPSLVIHIYPDCDAHRHWRPLKRIAFFNSLYLSRKGLGAIRKTLRYIGMFSPLSAFYLEKFLRATILSEYSYRSGIKKDIKLFEKFIEFIEQRGHFYVLGFWDLEGHGLKNYFIKNLRQLNSEFSLVLTGFNEYLSVCHSSEFIKPNDGHPNELGEQMFSYFISQKIMKEKLK